MTVNPQLGLLHSVLIQHLIHGIKAYQKGTTLDCNRKRPQECSVVCTVACYAMFASSSVVFVSVEFPALL